MIRIIKHTKFRVNQLQNKSGYHALILCLSTTVKNTSCKYYERPTIHDLIAATTHLSIYHEFRHRNRSLQTALEQCNFSESLLRDSHSLCTVLIDLMSLRSVRLRDWNTIRQTLSINSPFKNFEFSENRYSERRLSETKKPNRNILRNAGTISRESNRLFA